MIFRLWIYGNFNRTVGQKNHSFIDMITSAEDFIEEQEEDDIEELFFIKTEPKLNQKGSSSLNYVFSCFLDDTSASV